MSKSKKQQAAELLSKHFSDYHIEAIIGAIEIMTSKPKPKEQSDGSKVWDAYEEAFKQKYPISPKRNATTNNQAKQLAARIGVDDAMEVVRFYLSQSDSFYVRSYHPLGVCLKYAEELYARMKTGKTVTRKAADKIESAAATLNASSAYLERKYQHKRDP